MICYKVREDITMRAKDVNPSNFKVENVVFENEDFSIAIGIWANGDRRMAMRWNGHEDDPGYPNALRYVKDSDRKEIEAAILKF